MLATALAIAFVWQAHILRHKINGLFLIANY
jgi:hypothetical protein